MPIVKLPEMDKKEIESLVRGQILCRIAFKGDKYPYMAPFQYAFIDGSLYFHFTDYGKKMKLLEKDKRVCVEIETYRPDLSEYSFVVMRGTLKQVTNAQERTKAIEKMVEDGRKRLSPNFLAAHGLRKQNGWTSLAPDKPLFIVKLEHVVEEVGLKSPSPS